MRLLSFVARGRLGNFTVRWESYRTGYRPNDKDNWFLGPPLWHVAIMSGRASLLVPPSGAIMLWLGGWKGLASRLWLAQSLLLLLRKFNAASAALPCRRSGSPTSRGARRLLSNQLLRPPSGQAVVVVFYSVVDWTAVLKRLESSRIFALNFKMRLFYRTARVQNSRNIVFLCKR